MMKKKLIALFPGIRYSTDMPLLYYARFCYELQGYDILNMEYQSDNTEGKSIPDFIEDVKKTVLHQVERIDFSQYEDILFVSKSVGTVFAGWLEEIRDLKVRHIYLTPLEQTLQYLRGEKNIKIVIAGNMDKYLNAELLKQHCDREGISLYQIEGLGHRLEVKGDMKVNLDILKQIVSLY
jgi:hypothetical protein